MTPTVLIVDDKAANRDALVALLEPEGYGLVQAASGPEALEAVAACEPDLVLLDVMMPGMDGYEVCRRLRADERHREIPIILVTALDDRASRLTGIEAGADDFVSKPFDRAELRARVRTVTRLNRYARLMRERRTVEEVSRHVREQAALIDLDPDAFVVLGADGRVRLWNAGAARLFGLSAGEVLGRSAAGICVTDPPGQMEEADRRARQTGVWHGEITCTTGDGSPLVLESHWTRLDDGEPRLLVVSRDITARKQEEQHRLRTQRLENLGALAGGIAHDLNNILTPILIATELFRETATGRQEAELVATIGESTRRGASMVKQILSFVRGTEAGKVQVQVGHLVKDLLTLVRDTFPRAIECRAELAPDLPLVIADPTQLYQVLLNLLVNARDAMPDGGRLTVAAKAATVDEVSARTLPDARPGTYVAVSVIDTGTGIPPEVRARMFEPFYTTKAPGKGTGLGLATVREVVTAHAGFLHVESEVGRGTQFTVYVPASAGEVTAAPPAGLVEVPHGRGELVLVVDDEASVREIARTTLEAFGYRAVSAGNGIEAAAQFTRHASDVALLAIDMEMPIMDGKATIAALRSLNPALPVLAMSGSGTQGDQLREAGIEVQGFLLKPFSAEALLRAVARIVAAA